MARTALAFVARCEPGLLAILADNENNMLPAYARGCDIARHRSEAI